MVASVFWNNIQSNSSELLSSPCLLLSSSVDSAMDLTGSSKVMKKGQATHTKAGARWAGLSTGKISALWKFSKLTTHC